MNKQVLNKLQELFFNSSEEEFNNYLNSLRNPNILIQPTTFLKPQELTFLSPERYNLYIIDQGDGPIGKGLSSLEVVSSELVGINRNSLAFFDKTTKLNVNQIRNSTNTQLQEIIINEISMTEHFLYGLENGSPQVVDFLKNVNNIMKVLKVGRFKKSNFITPTLDISKKLIKFNISKAGV
jgi:hypothetical protein